MAPEEEVPVCVRRQQPGDGAVAEVEHEPRALVLVVEEVRLAAGRDEQDASELGLGYEERAAEAESHRIETLSYSIAYAFSHPSRCAIQGAACQTE